MDSDLILRFTTHILNLITPQVQFSEFHLFTVRSTEAEQCKTTTTESKYELSCIKDAQKNMMKQ